MVCLQIQLIPHQDDDRLGGNPGFTLCITPPKQTLIPSSSPTGTSPPTHVTITYPRGNVTSASELQAVQVQVTRGVQSGGFSPRLDNRTVHYRSSPDVVENSKRQTRVRFDSTPNTNCGAFPSGESDLDYTRKITSNPEIFQQQSEGRDPHEVYSGSVVLPNHSAQSITNPFIPNFDVVQNAAANRAATPTRNSLQANPSHSSTILVKAGDKDIDVTAFDPVRLSQTPEPNEAASQRKGDVHESGSYVIVDASTETAETEEVDFRDFDPIAPQTPTTLSPPSPTPIPAIPPPPPTHRRTPRTSESDLSENARPRTTASRASTLSSPPNSTTGNAEFSAAASSHQESVPSRKGKTPSVTPTSPTSADADGIFDISDVKEDDSEPS